MIVSKSSRKERRIEVDLTGPQGNAFCVLGLAHDLAKQTGKDWEDIRKRMTSGEYDNLINVFEAEFGDQVVIYK